LLGQWQWPGNLRELENWVARVVILGSQEKLAEELRDQAVLDGAPNDLSGLDDNVPDEAQQAVSAATQAAILRILEAHGWSRRRAARELRMSYRALLGRLRNANAPRRRRSHKESPPSG
jgi:two-component system, NtrC family, response regulator AtoC